MSKTIREMAEAYEPKTTKNIADLKEVSTELDLQNKSFTNNDGELVQYQAIIVDGQEYRVPVSVLKQLKAMIEAKPDMTKFKVVKKGTTKNDTTYTVVPLD